MTRGIRLGKETLSSDKKMNKSLAMKFDPMVKIELEMTVVEIRSPNQRIARLERTIADEGKLAACFGIAPRVSKSNETERWGWITKRGRFAALCGRPLVGPSRTTSLA